jgi:glycosyltransferase involved in cell wall biosynthesis
MGSLRIAVLGTRGFPDVQGGVERHCEELYPRLVRLGCDVTVFTRTPYIPKEKRVKEWKGVKFIHLWSPRKKALEAITHTFLGVVKARGISPDILHIHAVGPSLLTPMAKLSGVKVVITHHGPDYEREKWGRVAKMALAGGERFGVLYSDGLIAISRGIKELIKIKYGREAVFIPNGVNIPFLIPPGEELRRWGLEPKRYIFTACRFVPEKGLFYLIEAYRGIKDPPFKLVIAGDADHETDYSRRLKRLASETEGVVLTGFISGGRLGELFSNAGLFILPSFYEGLPIALLEALSYGLPVLVSDIPQHREIPLSEFRYFEKGNIKILSEAVMEVFPKGITETERQTYISLIRNNHNWDSIASKTLKVYTGVLH